MSLETQYKRVRKKVRHDQPFTGTTPPSVYPPPLHVNQSCIGQCDTSGRVRSRNAAGAAPRSNAERFFLVLIFCGCLCIRARSAFPREGGELNSSSNAGLTSKKSIGYSVQDVYTMVSGISIAYGAGIVVGMAKYPLPSGSNSHLSHYVPQVNLFF